MITDKLVYSPRPITGNRLAQLGTGLFAALCTLPAMRPVGAHWLAALTVFQNSFNAYFATMLFRRFGPALSGQHDNHLMQLPGARVLVAAGRMSSVLEPNASHASHSVTTR
jgi:hypothetical protein